MNLIMFEDLVTHLHSLLYEHTSLIHILGIIRPTNESLEFTQVYFKLLWYSANVYKILIPKYQLHLICVKVKSLNGVPPCNFFFHFYEVLGSPKNGGTGVDPYDIPLELRGLFCGLSPKDFLICKGIVLRIILPARKFLKSRATHTFVS